MGVLCGSVENSTKVPLEVKDGGALSARLYICAFARERLCRSECMCVQVCNRMGECSAGSERRWCAKR